MEQTTTKILMPTAGIANLTPQQVCEDNELRDCKNLTYYNGALRPIRKPFTTDINTDGKKLLYVHELNSEAKNYITADGNKLYAITSDGTKTIDVSLKSDILNVNSIGNTLIVTVKDNGIYYYLWTTNSIGQLYYEPLGNKIPVPEFSFALSKNGYNWNGERFINVNDLPSQSRDILQTGRTTYDSYYKEGSSYIHVLTREGTQGSSDAEFVRPANNSTKEDLENLFAGLYAEGKKLAHKNKAFVNPFFAVGALRLYDGSYHYISNPVLMFPNINGAFNAPMDENAGKGKVYGVVSSHYLYYKQTTDYIKWKDIVDDVCIFVSDEIETLNTSELKVFNITNDNGSETYEQNCVAAYWHQKFPSSASGSITRTDSICIGSNNLNTFASENRGGIYFTSSDYDKYHNMIPFFAFSAGDFYNEVVNRSTFFHLCDIGFETKTAYTSTESKIKYAVLENITTQQQLPNIDYYSFCSLIPSGAQTFNRRLNLYGVKRSFFEGFKSFLPISDGNNHFYTITVTIKTPEGNKNVVHSFNTYDVFFDNMWFYYPDPRAIRVTIKHNNSTTILNAELKEHKGLNGAYYIGSSFPTLMSLAASSGIDTFSLPTQETLANYLLQSEVDNPFTFNAAGYIRVGQGTILGLSALTTALSQDAYKVATTICFTTQGIWALSIDGTGRYSSVAPPYSREVCNNPYSITMIDNGVFFSSQKGLMLIDDNGVRSVTPHMNGKADSLYSSFNEYIKDSSCRFAYDYRENLLWIINCKKNGNDFVYSYHWIFNIASMTLSRLENNEHYKSIVSDYPDTLIQLEDNTILSLYNRPDINDDNNTYNGSFVTRPIKFSDVMHMKTLRQILHFNDFNGQNENFSVSVRSSNDCRTWIPLSSLNGRGYKFYEFSLTFQNLKAIDSYAGSIIAYNVSETNKLR